MRQWSDQVRERGTLQVFKHASMDSGLWNGVFEQALSAFNTLSQSHSLGVRLVTANSAPVGYNRAGADIMVQLSSGQIQTGTPESPRTRQFNGQGLHGYTSTQMMRFGSNDPIIFNCFVHLPNDPQLNVGLSSQRPVGEPVALCILVHEFIHCCGLSNDEHVQPGSRDGGIFSFPGEVRQGQSPAGDRMHPFGMDGPDMPPIVLSDATAGNIRRLWQRNNATIPNRQGSLPTTPDENGRQGRGPVGFEQRYAVESTRDGADNYINSSSWRRPGPYGTTA